MKLVPLIPRILGRVVHGAESSIRPVGWAHTGSFQRGISLVVSLVFALLLWSAGVGLAQTLDTTLWVANGIGVTNGLVESVVPHGNTIYICGYFQQVGPPRTGCGVALDASTGLPAQPYPQVTGTLNVVASDGSGGWYLGGQFTAVLGQPRNNLAQLDAGGNLTTWNPNANGVVRSLAVNGGTVYAGGHFTGVGGQPRNHIAAMDSATGAATSWDPNADAAVLALAVSGGTVYAGGGFTSIGGQPRNCVAAIDAATGAATSWDPNANVAVRALAVSGGTVYAGGNFTSIGGLPRNYIGAIDAASGAATGWNPNANGAVYALVVSGGMVYAGGSFQSIGGGLRNNIAAINAATGTATGWNPNTNGLVAALAVSGGTVYAGGTFTFVGGTSRKYIAAIDAATGAATAWDPYANGTVFGLAVSGGTVYAGGGFTTIGGAARPGIAALDAATGAVTAWNPPPLQGYDPRVLAVAVSAGTVYIGGRFTGIGGEQRDNLAAIDSVTGAVTLWNPSTNRCPDPQRCSVSVGALAVSGGTVYAGGVFSSIGGQPRNYIAAIDAVTGAATAWNPNANSYVNTLAVSGGTVYVGGGFTSIGGQPRNRIAALDAATGAATAWNPNADQGVFGLAVSGGTVYAGGGFTSIGGQPRNRIAALDATTGTATAWNPNAPNPSESVYTLAVSGSTVYAGGNFTFIGGQPRNYIAALDAASGVATAWNPNAGSNATQPPLVYALAVNGCTVYAGGQFNIISGQSRPGIAAFMIEGGCGSLSVSGDPSIMEGSLTVAPNPARAAMQIQYAVARAGRVRLELLDVTGRVEATLADRVQAPGRFAVAWNGVGRRGRLSPGLHFIRLVAPDGVMVRKLAIIR